MGLIPREVLEATYGIMLPTPREDEDPRRPPTAHELLATYGLMRGYMSHKVSSTIFYFFLNILHHFRMLARYFKT